MKYIGYRSKACFSLGYYILHSSNENSIVVERAMQYLKDRTEAFDVYFIFVRNGSCSLQHV